MVDVNVIRNKLAIKIFQNLGSTFLVSSVLSYTTSKWGDKEITYDLPETMIGVPYNLISPKSYEKFGDLTQGQMDVVFDYLSSINMDSSVLFAGKGYLIIRLEDFDIKDSVLAKLARLAERM